MKGEHSCFCVMIVHVLKLLYSWKLEGMGKNENKYINKVIFGGD